MVSLSLVPAFWRLMTHGLVPWQILGEMWSKESDKNKAIWKTGKKP